MVLTLKQIPRKLIIVLAVKASVELITKKITKMKKEKKDYLIDMVDFYTQHVHDNGPLTDEQKENLSDIRGQLSEIRNQCAKSIAKCNAILSI